MDFLRLSMKGEYGIRMESAKNRNNNKYTGKLFAFLLYLCYNICALLEMMKK